MTQILTYRTCHHPRHTPGCLECKQYSANYNGAHDSKNWTLAQSAKLLYGKNRVRKNAHGRYVKGDFTPEEQAAIEAHAKLEKDETPVKTRDYWTAQNPDYIKALQDPMYQEERRRAKADPRQSLTGGVINDGWRRKLEVLDPSHPKALVPDWVRFAKRKDLGFKCKVLGWHETDWMVNKQSGEIRQVGTLTVDHTLAGANGGLTTDANTAMVASIVNSKKGAKMKTYAELREHLHSIYELYHPTIEELAAMRSLRDKGYKKVVL